MSLHICPDDKEEFKSEIKYNFHRLMQHDVYSNNVNIIEAAERSLDGDNQIAEYILRRFAGTRGDDNQFCERWKQIIGKRRVYNPEYQTWQDKDPNGVPFKNYFKREYDMVRARQKIQKRAIMGKQGYKWEDLMPTDIVVLKRRRLYEIFRRLHAQTELQTPELISDMRQ